MAATLPEHVKGWNIGAGPSRMSVAEVAFWASGWIYEAGGPMDEGLTKIDPKRASLWVEPSERPYPPGTTVLQIDTVGEQGDVLRPMAAILYFCVEREAGKSGPDHSLIIPEYVVRQANGKGGTGIHVLKSLGFADIPTLREGGLVVRADHLKHAIDSQFPEFAGAVALPRASSGVPVE